MINEKPDKKNFTPRSGVKFFYKKGIFFTFIAITITFVFIFVFTPRAYISLEKNTQTLRSRINSVNSYASDLENRYLENVLRAAAYKTMLSLVSYIEVKKTFIPNADFNAVFYEVMTDGTISEPIGSSNHVPIDSITGKKIMEGSTLKKYSDAVIQKARDTLNVDTEITISKVSVSQERAWDIEPEIEVSLKVKASDVSSEWDKNNLKIKTNLSIIGFNDPYYIAKTDGAYKNKIKRLTSEINMWDINKVKEYLDNGAYFHWPESSAPDFLMRFTNNLGASACCGIESFVPPQIAGDKSEVYIDYLFWNPSSNPKCATHPNKEPELYRITGLPAKFDGFKLDPENIVRYNLQNNAAQCG